MYRARRHLSHSTCGGVILTVCVTGRADRGRLPAIGLLFHSMPDIDSLRRQFGGDDLDFVYVGEGLIKASCTNTACTGELFLHGATVTHFEPAGQKPVIFVSRESFFQPDKAIRGGIPICWPWFGPHPTDARQPQHGLVRAVPWQLQAVQKLDTSRTRLKLAVQTHDADAVLLVTFGPKLELSLQTTSKSGSAFRLEEALHTYLHVGDSRKVWIEGLAGRTYIDKTAKGVRAEQSAKPIRFESETDRVYLNTESACVLNDPVLGRKITVNKTGSKSTVVWNPWFDKARALSDFGDDEWQKMCCIETANAADNHILLASGQSHTMTAEIAVSPL